MSLVQRSAFFTGTAPSAVATARSGPQAPHPRSQLSVSCSFGPHSSAKPAVPHRSELAPHRLQAVALDAPLAKEAIFCSSTARPDVQQREQLELLFGLPPAPEPAVGVVELPNAASATAAAFSTAATAGSMLEEQRQQRQQQSAGASTSGRPSGSSRTPIVTTTRGTRHQRQQRRSRHAGVQLGRRQRLPATVAGSSEAAALEAVDARHYSVLQRMRGLRTQQQRQHAAAPKTETERDVAYLGRLRAQLRRYRQQRRKGTTSGSDAVTMFLNSMGDTPVLTKDQETRLGRILQRGVRLERLAEEVASKLGRRPTAQELAEAAGLAGGAAEATAVVANKKEAQDLMLHFNLRLVVNVAKRYAGRGVEIGDLIPDGINGLSKAIARFDPDKGFKFSTYSHWWIRQAISRVAADQRIVRLPVHIYEVLYKINKAAEALEAENVGEEFCRDLPSARHYQQIADALGMPVKRVTQLMAMASKARKFEIGVAEFEARSEVPWEEVAAEDVFEEDPSGVAEQRADYLATAVNVILSTLPKRERNILRLHYGLIDPEQLFAAGAAAAAGTPAVGLQYRVAAQAAATAAADHVHSESPREWAGADMDIELDAGMTLGELACAYNLSKERIRQIEDRALRNLRKPWRLDLLRLLRDGCGSAGVLSADALGQLAAAGSTSEQPYFPGGASPWTQ